MASRVRLILMVTALPALLTGHAGAQSFDLRANWSDTQNPSGAWAYRDGESLLTAIPQWQGAPWLVPQPGWGRASLPGVAAPFCFRSNGAEDFPHDWLAGDIVISSGDRTGMGGGVAAAANVAWTSPLDGMVKLIGGVWAGRELQRAQRFSLLHNQLTLFSGSVSTGDSHNRAAPFAFTDGLHPNSAEIDRDVSRGDTISVEVAPVNASGLGDFVGVSLNIVVCIGATRQPEHAIMCPGGDATLSLQARTSYGTITYRWRKNGVPLLESAKFRGVFGPVLTVTGVAAADAASYDCVLGSVCSVIISHPATLALCPANFACSGTLGPADIFAFMNAWFAGDPRADIGRNGSIDVQDIFEFVAGWFTGC